MWYSLFVSDILYVVSVSGGPFNESYQEIVLHMSSRRTSGRHADASVDDSYYFRGCPAQYPRSEGEIKYTKFVENTVVRYA
jgi:hypothetical protein